MKKVRAMLFICIVVFFLIPNMSANAEGRTPVFIQMGEHVFSVALSGEVPVDESTVLEFVPNVYIAHNGLAGKHFINTATIQYSDGTVVNYEATEIIVLQAIDPYDPSTKYTDGKYVYTSDDIHHRIFTLGEVVFATCYDKNGQVGWGRKFIIMEEK
jgi:hypothetical protein